MARDYDKIIKAIVQRLKEVRIQPLALKKYIRQLGILSRLRKLGEITNKTLRKMPITYDKDSDFLYQEGKAEGETKGEAKGEAKAKDEIILRLLQQGLLSLEQIAEITEKPLEYIQKIKKP